MPERIQCQDVEENSLADLYVLGRLLPEEAEAFEDHYMSCDTCVAEVERAEVMVKGFKQVAAENLSTASVKTPPTGDFKPVAPAAGPQPGSPTSLDDFRGRTKNRRRVRSIGSLLAAAVAGAVLTSPLWLDSSRRSQVEAGPVAVYHLQSERSAGTESRHRVAPESQGRVVLALEPAPPFYERYRATLQSQHRVVWQADDLALGERDTVSLQLPEKPLAKGDYRLLLEASHADRWVDAGIFAFHVE